MPLNKYNPNNTNVKSLIGGINTQLKQYFNTFGGQSKEYLDLYSKVTDTLKGSIYRQGISFNQDNPSEPLQISQSKNVLKDFSDKAQLKKLQDLRNELHNRGTALEKAQPYIEYQKKQDNIPVKELANINYQISNNQTAMYDMVKSQGDESDKEEMSKLFTEMNITSRLDFEELLRIKKQIVDLYNKYDNKYDNNETDDYENIETNDYNTFESDEFVP